MLRKGSLWMMAVLGALGFTGPAAAQAGVAVELDQFGAGSLFRPGEITAIRLKLTSNLNEPKPVWVQWEVPNVDGDVVEYGRSLALTPSQPALTWLYAPLAPDADTGSVWTVRVFEERDGERGREIGGTRISPSTIFAQRADSSASMLLVVNDRRMGLEDYATQGSRGQPRPDAAHEDTRIASGLKPSQLPDRWWGLFPNYDAIAWSGEMPPQDLGVDQANALREYVRRGGHLIISLPAARNPWGLGAIGQTQLEDMLPCRTPGLLPRTDQAVPLRTLLPVLGKFNRVDTLIGTRSEPEFTIRVFKDLTGSFNVIDNHYEPLIALPDGRVIVIQRLYGHGRVTVVGLDLAEQRLASLGLPQADAFWNRILGRRADTPTASELQAIDSQGRLNKGAEDVLIGSGKLFSESINFPGEASKGLLLAILIFAAYWLLAGPLGFFLLKQYGYTRHAWIVFAGCAALFTAIAWGSVGLMPKRLQIKHVTFLDHIARPAGEAPRQEPQHQRAISYFAAYLPDYGNTPIAIESSPDQRDVLVSWIPPGAGVLPFPNVDRYRVDVSRGFHAYSLPARSTATQLHANWMGALDPDWGGLLREDHNDPIRVNMMGGSEDTLSGTIINDLPGTLSNVTVIWVKNNRPLPRRYEIREGNDQPWVPRAKSGELLNTGEMWRLADPLEAKKPLHLAAVTSRATAMSQRLNTSLRENIDQRYVKAFENLQYPSLQIHDADRPRSMEMLSFFQQLTPPVYLKLRPQDSNTDTVAFRRDLGRELDLSAWFTRPCIIIIGFLDGSASPVPVRLDGRPDPVESDGLTVVRWVYPLPLEESISFREAFTTDGDDG